MMDTEAKEQYFKKKTQKTKLKQRRIMEIKELETDNPVSMKEDNVNVDIEFDNVVNTLLRCRTHKDGSSEIDQLACRALLLRGNISSSHWILRLPSMKVLEGEVGTRVEFEKHDNDFKISLSIPSDLMTGSEGDNQIMWHGHNFNCHSSTFKRR